MDLTRVMIKWESFELLILQCFIPLTASDTDGPIMHKHEIFKIYSRCALLTLLLLTENINFFFFFVIIEKSFDFFYSTESPWLCAVLQQNPFHYAFGCEEGNSHASHIHNVWLFSTLFVCDIYFLCALFSMQRVSWVETFCFFSTLWMVSACVLCTSCISGTDGCENVFSHACNVCSVLTWVGHDVAKSVSKNEFAQIHM